MRTTIHALSGTVLLMAACGSHAAPDRAAKATSPQAAAPATSAAALASHAGPPAVAGVAWTVPATWTPQPPRSMRIATYTLPGGSGATPGECAVYYFGPDQGGGVDANVSRWAGQFEGEPAPKRSTRAVGGLRITTVEVAGTYLAPGGPMMQSQGRQPGTVLLGAIVEGPQGPVFFKGVGPRATMEANRAAFDGLIASLHTP